jgi:hypothetical protein
MSSCPRVDTCAPDATALRRPWTIDAACRIIVESIAGACGLGSAAKVSSALVTALRCTTPDAACVFPLLPHPTAITAAAVKTIVSSALELDGRLIGEVISGPFSWFLSRASVVL